LISINYQNLSEASNLAIHLSSKAGRPQNFKFTNYGLKGQEHIKNDERILWESDFVADVLFQANEKFEPKYELKRVGYDFGGGCSEGC